MLQFTNTTSLMSVDSVDKLYGIYATWYVVDNGSQKFYSCKDLVEVLGPIHFRSLECEVNQYLIESSRVSLHPVCR